MAMDMQGQTKRKATGRQCVRVLFNEEVDGLMTLVPYEGTVVHADWTRGLRVEWDLESDAVAGSSRKRDWVNDEDEWEWCQTPEPAPSKEHPAPGVADDTASEAEAAYEALLDTAKEQAAAACEAAQKLMAASHEVYLSICLGSVHPRTLAERPIKEVDLTSNPASCPLPDISPRTNLEQINMSQLIAWLSWKLNYPISPEMRATREPLVSHVECVLALVSEHGDTLDWAQRHIKMHALGSWMQEDDTLTEPRTLITSHDEIVRRIQTQLCDICDLYNAYMPLSFHSTYKRAFGLLGGFGVRARSMRMATSNFRQLDSKGDIVCLRPALLVTMDVGASQKLAVVYTTTVAFLAEWIDPANGETFPSRVLHSPASECSCPCRVCCAHGLAVMHALDLMQRSTSWDHFCECCPSYSAATAASSAVVWFDHVHFWPQRSRKFHMQLEAGLAARYCGSDGQSSAAGPSCGHEEREAEASAVSQAVQETSSFGRHLDILHPDPQQRTRPEYSPGLVPGNNAAFRTLLDAFYCEGFEGMLEL